MGLEIFQNLECMAQTKRHVEDSANPKPRMKIFFFNGKVTKRRNKRVGNEG